MRARVEHVSRFCDVHLVDGHRIWATQNTALVVSGDAGKTWRRMTTIPTESWKQILGSFSFSRRLLRLGIHNVVKLKNDTILAVSNGKIYRFAVATSSQPEIVHALRRGKRPLKNGLTVDNHDRIFYGEYFSNPEREAVQLWVGTQDGRDWKVVLTLPPGSARHIHIVQYDPYEDKLWLGTGDRDNECSIGYLTDNLQTFTPIGSGSQVWRAVSLVFCPEHIYWGTDDPDGSNFIYRWSRCDGKLEKLAPVKGPVYYSQKTKDYLLFTTTVEKITGEQDGYARIYALDNQDNVSELYCLHADFWHPTLFGYGRFELACGSLDTNQVWVSAKGLKGGEKSFLFEIMP